MRAIRLLQAHSDAIAARTCDEVAALLDGDGSPPGLAAAARAAFAAADREAERALARGLAPAPACSPGCSYCCHVHVDATVPEILAVAAHLHRTRAPAELDAIEAALERRAAEVETMTDEERWSARIPCALLGDDGRCSIYEARPLRCRAFHSCSVDPCRAAFEGRAGAEPIVSLPLERALDAVEDGYGRALERSGSTPIVRLETGLLHALASRS